MSQTNNGTVGGVQAAWAMAEKLGAGAVLTLDDAARIVAGCNGDSAAWYKLDKSKRAKRRNRARAILQAGVDAGAVVCDAILVNDEVVEVWEASKFAEIPF